MILIFPNLYTRIIPLNGKWLEKKNEPPGAFELKTEIKERKSLVFLGVERSKGSNETRKPNKKKRKGELSKRK